MMNMQKELEECIQSENYERAAVLRDKINAIKSNTGKKRKGEPAA
jgi:protein-arginine kinase activator protein McsA